MTKVIRVRYEKGVLKPLEKLDLKEGEELRVIIVDKSFYDLVEESDFEAQEDLNRIVSEIRKRERSIYE